MMENTSRRNLWIGLGILAVLLLFALPAWGGGMMVGRGVGPGAFGYGYGPHPFVGPAFFAFGFFGLLVKLLIWGALIFFAVRLFRGWGGWRGRGYDHFDQGRTEYSDLPPAEILRRRYAAGEISREQYEEIRKTLEG
jgi:putative membrane protein